MSRTVAGFDGSQSKAKRNGKVDRIGYWIRGRGVDLSKTQKLPAGSRTVDQVEMTALRSLCETLSQLGITDAIIQGDSKRVIEKVLHHPSNGDALLSRCKEYFKKNPDWLLFWVSRDQNGRADIIAKNCIS